jgi:hypothetical protein
VKRLTSENVANVLTYVKMNKDNIIPKVTEKRVLNRNYTDAAQAQKNVHHEGQEVIGTYSVGRKGKLSL